MRLKPRLLVLNQYYWPGVEATGNLLAQLCEGLVEEFEVTVVTGRLRGHAEVPGRIFHNGVEIIRVRSTMFERARLAPRAVNYVSFLLHALIVSYRLRRPDALLCMTDPPLLGNVALPVARHFGVPLVVVSQDVFPEIAVELQRLEQP
ncbi:MAG TPA: glycosyltransferase, partial [Acidimicrobiales bacterium]|nr:glycosyltransferase [Acidimicrobiales bacterium]